MGIGLKIKEEAQKRGVSLAQLSKMTGISVNTFYTMTQRDAYNIRPKNLNKIAEALGVDAAFLCKDEATSKPSNISGVSSEELQQALAELRKTIEKTMTSITDRRVENAILFYTSLLTLEGKTSLLSIAKVMASDERFRHEQKEETE